MFIELTHELSFAMDVTGPSVLLYLISFIVELMDITFVKLYIILPISCVNTVSCLYCMRVLILTKIMFEVSITA